MNRFPFFIPSFFQFFSLYSLFIVLAVGFLALFLELDCAKFHNPHFFQFISIFKFLNHSFFFCVLFMHPSVLVKKTQ